MIPTQLLPITCHLVPGRAPGQHDDDDQDVDGGAKDEYRNPADFLYDEAKPDGGSGITNSKNDENPADNMDTVGAGHESLRGILTWSQFT